MNPICGGWRGVASGLLLIFYSVAAWGQPAVEVVEHTEHGRINWSRGLLLAEGVAAPETPADDRSDDREADVAEARRRALRALSETAMEVPIRGPWRVRGVAENSDLVAAKIKDMVRQAHIMAQEYLSDGTVAVSMEMSLFGGFSQLVLPPEIKSIESLKTIRETVGQPGVSSPVENSDNHPFTGLVVDARGLGCRPGLFPLILDEVGKEVYGSAFASREYAVQKGMSGYTMDAAAAMREDRVAPRPMLIKGLRVHPANSSVVVISNADGSRIRSRPEHLTFLKTCAVVIVVD
jgi:hypothetical protein